jgi:hypothetical protein
MVYLSESSVHGFGVFADKNYNIGDTLELCYYLVTDDSDMTNTCILHDYVFGTPNEEEEYLVPLGNAMMYNHSSDPNAEWEIHDDNNFIRFKAVKNIKKGEEILHDYGDEYWESRDGKGNSKEEDRQSCEGAEESFQITRKAS